MNEFQLRVPAAKRRKNVAPRAQARGLNSIEVPALEGRKIPRVHSNLAPLRGWARRLLFPSGLRPGLHSYAAPRLKTLSAQLIHNRHLRFRRN
jgi:hypothetical protein